MNTRLLAASFAGLLLLSTALACNPAAPATVTTTVYTGTPSATAPASSATALTASTNTMPAMSAATGVIPSAILDNLELTAIRASLAELKKDAAKMERGDWWLKELAGNYTWKSPSFNKNRHVNLTILTNLLKAGESVTVTVYLYGHETAPNSSSAGYLSRALPPITTEGLTSYEFEAERFEVNMVSHDETHAMIAWSSTYPLED